ncbi:MAG TPA: hypothetical protein VH092_08905 [Urbifossiella sp.]|jgi:hypothetical protein|nr:hypothetical protein [Urbifossiella sp.]
MRRFLFGTLAVIVTGGTAVAQHHGGGGHAGGHVGGAHMGAAHVGGFHPAGNYHIVQSPVYRSGGIGLYGGGIGLYGGYGGLGYGGYGGGGYGGGGYGYGAGAYSPYYGSPSYGALGAGGPVYVPVLPNTPPAAISGLLPATLIIQYPVAAKVWLDGVEIPGDPDVSWTLTSKDLRPGETATFKIRGRWEADGKTYEATREIPLGPGARSRLVVVSGNEVKE